MPEIRSKPDWRFFSLSSQGPGVPSAAMTGLWGYRADCHLQGHLRFGALLRVRVWGRAQLQVVFQLSSKGVLCCCTQKLPALHLSDGEQLGLHNCFVFSLAPRGTVCIQTRTSCCLGKKNIPHLLQTPKGPSGGRVFCSWRRWKCRELCHECSSCNPETGIAEPLT
jgi:hypothetical protein